MNMFIYLTTPILDVWHYFFLVIVALQGHYYSSAFTVFSGIFQALYSLHLQQFLLFPSSYFSCKQLWYIYLLSLN